MQNIENYRVTSSKYISYFLYRCYNSWMLSNKWMNQCEEYLERMLDPFWNWNRSSLVGQQKRKSQVTSPACPISWYSGTHLRECEQIRVGIAKAELSKLSYKFNTFSAANKYECSFLSCVSNRVSIRTWVRYNVLKQITFIRFRSKSFLPFGMKYTWSVSEFMLTGLNKTLLT